MFKFQITNIDCEACVKLSKSALQNLSGVSKVEIDQTGLGMVEGDEKISWDTVVAALAEVNKTAVLINE